MSADSITVFVRRRGMYYHANTHQATAMDANSPERAAIKCAARQLQVQEAAVRLIPDGDHVFVAYVDSGRREPARVSAALRFLCFFLSAVLTAAGLYIVWKTLTS